MAFVTLRSDEGVDKAIRRFKKKVEAAGILKDARKHEHFLKPSVRKKEKLLAADKRRRRTEARLKRA